MRKNLGTKQRDEKCREETRMQDLKDFDPRIESHRNFDQEKFGNFLTKIKNFNQNAVIFKSLDDSDQNEININAENIELICYGIFSTHLDASEADFTAVLLKHLHETSVLVHLIETNTREQANCSLWSDMRKGRLTAPKHHDIYAKVNTVSRSTNTVRTKITPLVAQILNLEKPLKLESIKSGVDHEQDALKAFYAKHCTKHQDFKTEKSGLHIYNEETYIVAYPDGFMSCKCHCRFTLEVKCPLDIRDQKITDGMKECKFLTISLGNITMDKGHKYYTQIVSQMAITKTHQAVSIVWTFHNLFSEYIPFDKDHFENVKTNLIIFFKTYVCPALLG